MKTTNPHIKILRAEQGMVAFTVTLIMMAVITLLVLSFARIIRREQRQALDRQLSSQAFYAAESGVNDAVKAIAAGYTGEKPACGTLPAATSMYLSNNQIAGSSTVSYPCLLISQAPSTLEYGNIDHESKIIPLNTYNGATPTPADSVTFTWKDKVGLPASLACASPNFPAASAWNCSVGVLRIDLVSVPNGAALSRDGLNRNMFSAFLYPTSSGGASAGYTTANDVSQGAVFNASCTGNPLTCTFTVNGLLAANNSTNYFLRVRSIYRPVSLTITAASGATSLQLKGAQSLIDATGKAQDVIRRVQVRVPSNRITLANLPDYAVQAGDGICKRYYIIPPIGSLTTDTGALTGSSGSDICSIN